MYQPYRSPRKTGRDSGKSAGRRQIFLLLLLTALLLGACSRGSGTETAGESVQPSAGIPQTTAGIPQTSQTAAVPSPGTAPAASSENETEAPSTTETETPADPETEPETSSEDKPEAPSVSYDADTKVLSVNGTGNYGMTVFPAAFLSQAKRLEVEDDEFQLNASLLLLQAAGVELETALPDFLDRTEKSLHFIRTYLKENAASVYPADMAKPVLINITGSGFGWRVQGGKIIVNCCDDILHTEFLYLHALINSDSVGWEQLGYAWYVGTCIDPYYELPEKNKDSIRTVPYYPIAAAAGLDPDRMTPADFRTMYDADSRYCFGTELTYWGSACESAPVTVEATYTRKQPEPRDQSLSAFMAASFIGWLDETYGFEAVSGFCFGQKSFEEAFGTDFDSAFTDWKTQITETYPWE